MQKVDISVDIFLVVTFLLLPEIPSWRLSEGHPQELEVLLLVPRLAALPPDPAEPLQLHLDLGRDERSAEEQCPHRARCTVTWGPLVTGVLSAQMRSGGRSHW